MFSQGIFPAFLLLPPDFLQSLVQTYNFCSFTNIGHLSKRFSSTSILKALLQKEQAKRS